MSEIYSDDPMVILVVDNDHCLLHSTKYDESEENLALYTIWASNL